MGDCLRKQRQLARYIKETCSGPLGSETDIDEQLLGEFVDTGDFGIFDGYHRVTPSSNSAGSITCRPSTAWA